MVFFQVDLDGVGPVTRQVGQKPVLDAVLLHREPEVLRKTPGRWAGGAKTTVHELPVHRPLAIQAIELERSRDAWGCRGIGERVERGICRRVHAVVRDGLGAYLDLQQQFTLSGSPYIGKNRDRVSIGIQTALAFYLTSNESLRRDL